MLGLSLADEELLDAVCASVDPNAGAPKATALVMRMNSLLSRLAISYPCVRSILRGAKRICRTKNTLKTGIPWSFETLRNLVGLLGFCQDSVETLERSIGYSNKKAGSQNLNALGGSALKGGD